MSPTDDLEKSREQLLAEVASLRAELAALRRMGGGEEAARASDDASASKLSVRKYETLLHRLTHLAESLGTARDHLTIFRDLRDFAVVSVPCIGIFISLYDEHAGVRRAQYAWGDGREVDVSTLPSMPVNNDGPNSRAVRTNRVVITNDYWEARQRETGSRSVVVGPDNGLRPQSSLIVPMATMRRIVGTIEVQSYENRAYKEEHVTAMRMAANLAAVAIENMRLLSFESRARAAAEESNRLKDEFLATLSHELRTPLTAILGWAHLLSEGNLSEETARTAVSVIERNANAQQQIVNDILDVSRIITGRLLVETETVDLGRVVESAAETVGPAAAAKRIRLKVEAGPETSPVVAGDARRLQQVFWNLLSNAVKFTPMGGEVRVTVRRDGTHARVVVEDTGAGIDPGFLPHVFERFRQADQTTTRRHGGLGLGLAIVRHLVELHGGTVEAASEGEGRGSTFTVALPLKPVEVEEEREMEAFEVALNGGGPPEEAARPMATVAGLHVLVVDDEPDALAFIRLALERAGARVSAALSAEEAFDLVSKGRPDLLIFDISMPDEDGYQLLSRVRAMEAARGTATPAIALTAYAGERDSAHSLVAGFQLHLTKPIEPEALVRAAARAARTSEAV